jgi:hypothetical protein
MIYILTVSLKILLIHVIFSWEGMIFYKAGCKAKEFLPQWFYKPLFDCMVCMTPYWGLLFWLIDAGLPTWHIITHLLILGGVNAVIETLVETKRADEL